MDRRRRLQRRRALTTEELRVAGLMSHAVWSVARGLARNVQEYKGHLAACDSGRPNDLDGRRALSEEAVAAFTEFFLTICIDRVTFMQSLLQPDGLRARVPMCAERRDPDRNVAPQSGEYPRSFALPR